MTIGPKRARELLLQMMESKNINSDEREAVGLAISAIDFPKLNTELLAALRPLVAIMADSLIPGKNTETGTVQLLNADAQTTPEATLLFYRVKYDTEYTGGDYNKTGKFAFIPEQLVKDRGINKAFEETMDEDPIHIIHYSEDERYNSACELVDDDSTTGRDPASVALDALRDASQALTELDPEANHHNAVLLDDALGMLGCAVKNSPKPASKTFLVRANCEYSTTIEATDGDEAIEKAAKIDVGKWESAAWSDYEYEEQ